MTRKTLRPVALLLPLFIAAIFWAAGSIFQTQPSDVRTDAGHFDRCSLSEHVNSCGYRAGQHSESSFGQRIGYRPGGVMPGMGYGQDSTTTSTGSMPDYLDAIAKDGSFRWSPERLPIDVYIEDGSGVPGYRPHFKAMIERAFDEWCDTSKGLLRWRQVSNPRMADVICTWTNNPTIRTGSVEAGQTRTLVQQNRYTGEGKIVNAQISILTELMGRPFSDINMYKTCLHEVGHALGLQGHSDVASDIMYPTVNDRQTAQLNQRDINTIARLYTSGGYDNVAGNGGMDRGGYTVSQYDDRSDRFGNALPPRAPQMQRGQDPRGGGYYSMRARHHMRGTWEQRAAIREYLRRAAEQGRFFN